MFILNYCNTSLTLNLIYVWLHEACILNIYIWLWPFVLVWFFGGGRERGRGNGMFDSSLLEEYFLFQKGNGEIIFYQKLFKKATLSNYFLCLFHAKLSEPYMSSLLLPFYVRLFSRRIQLLVLDVNFFYCPIFSVITCYNFYV